MQRRDIRHISIVNHDPSFRPIYSRIAVFHANLATEWVHDPKRALLELQRCVYSLGGCPDEKLPNNLEECEVLSKSCFLGRWYEETIEPRPNILQHTFLAHHYIGLAMARNGQLESEALKGIVAFLCQASCWPLVATRQAAISLALHLISGMCEAHIDPDQPNFLIRRSIARQLIDGCMFGHIALDTVNNERYRPPLMQIRDIQCLPAIIDMAEYWFSLNPVLFYEMGSKIIAALINDRRLPVASAGIKILINLLPQTTEPTNSFLVDFAFLSEVKDALVKRATGDKSNTLAATALHNIVESRSGIEGILMEEWQTIVAKLYR